MSTIDNTNNNTEKFNFFTRALEQAKQARDEITAREGAYKRIVISAQDEATLQKCFNISMAGFSKRLNLFFAIICKFLSSDTIVSWRRYHRWLWWQAIY